MKWNLTVRTKLRIFDLTKLVYFKAKHQITNKWNSKLPQFQSLDFSFRFKMNLILVWRGHPKPEVSKVGEFCTMAESTHTGNVILLCNNDDGISTCGLIRPHKYAVIMFKWLIFALSLRETKMSKNNTYLLNIYISCKQWPHT